jgi:hypothetical protein
MILVLRLKKLWGLIVMDNILHYTRRAAGIHQDDLTAPMIIGSVIEDLQSAQTKTKECKTNHIKWREEYLHGQAEAIVAKRCVALDAPQCT